MRVGDDGHKPTGKALSPKCHKEAEERNGEDVTARDGGVLLRHLGLRAQLFKMALSEGTKGLGDRQGFLLKVFHVEGLGHRTSSSS